MNDGIFSIDNLAVYEYQQDAWDLLSAVHMYSIKGWLSVFG